MSANKKALETRAEDSKMFIADYVLLRQISSHLSHRLPFQILMMTYSCIAKQSSALCSCAAINEYYNSLKQLIIRNVIRVCVVKGNERPRASVLRGARLIALMCSCVVSLGSVISGRGIRLSVSA